MKTSLKITYKGVASLHPLSLGDCLSIGRSSKCEFKLDDEKISGTHCRFILKKDRLEIVDLDSKNGTYLNGIRIENSEVFIGDIIKIGDTTITLEENSTDSEAMERLTFLGPAKDRMSHELKADFTGARNQNQAQKSQNSKESHAKEVNLRKKAKSSIKLSKHEIRARNKILAFISFWIDIGLLIVILGLLFLVNSIDILVLVIIEIVSIFVYTALNFKMAKFTIGEKITGLEKKYYQQ